MVTGGAAAFICGVKIRYDRNLALILNSCSIHRELCRTAAREKGRVHPKHIKAQQNILK